jgi:DnaJ-class molecular chaperone
MKCPWCGGTGETLTVDLHNCGPCRGTGEITEKACIAYREKLAQLKWKDNVCKNE